VSGFLIEGPTLSAVPRFHTAGVTLFHGDALELLPLMKTDRASTVAIFDPVWPNAPKAMFKYDPALLKAALPHVERLARRVIVILGCNSDPRCLDAVPASMPFVRAVWLRYEIPSAKGTVLNSGDVAYVFGDHHAKTGTTLIPGECSSKGSVDNAREKYDHPCPRDLGHMRWLVSRFTEPGDLVLDPFSGSGTTLQAARDHQRQSVGIEIEERFCRATEQRLRQLPLLLEEWAPKKRHSNSKLLMRRRRKPRAKGERNV
jgi:hypothetical protein